MNVFVGTSGYSYKEWKGVFYPEKMPAKDMLGFYASKFRTVEINNTFYRMPKADVLQGWVERVPESFVFVIKASQRITHHKRLKDVENELAYFMQVTEVLGPQLGPTLFQLPPNMKKDTERLKAFLVLIPPPRRVAFEFRHASWFEDEVYDALREANAAMCVADTGEEGDPPLVSTADWGYVRLRGVDYTLPELETWAKNIAAQPWRDAVVFFKHEDKATGPDLATKFVELSPGT